MPKQDVLGICGKAIRKDLGNIDDLPYELANTVANVYYRYFNQAIDVIKAGSNKPNWVPQEMEQEADVFEGLSSFLDKSAKIKSDVKRVSEHINNLRDIDKQNQPNLYQYIVAFILDGLKYDIKNAHKKSGLRRMIERKLKKGNVQEIPNLIDLINSR